MNKGTLSKKSRGYVSPLRESQSGQTRELILSSVARMLRAGELEELSFASVAKICGMSVATVYRYFPSRKALFDGLNEWLGKEIPRPVYPKSAAELLERTPEVFDYYARNYDLFTTQKIAGVMREMNKESSAGRDQALARLIAPYTRHLEERKANAVHALFRHLYGSDTYITMHDRFGVTAGEAAEAVSWAARLLIDNLAHAEKERKRK